MAQDTLNRIREAELAAKQLVKDAQASRTGIIADAKEEALQYKQELISKARSFSTARTCHSTGSAPSFKSLFCS